MDKANFIKTINKLRKDNKNNWYSIVLIVENKTVKIKGYNTWLQVYEIDGIDNSNCMDRSVKDFKNDLLVPFI